MGKWAGMFGAWCFLLWAGCGDSTQSPPTQGVCIPKSCEALARECGTVPDGCGGHLDCGTCGGEAARLFIQKDTPIKAFAADRTGGFITIDWEQVEGWSATGDRQWSHPFRDLPPNQDLGYLAAWVAPSGEILAYAQEGVGPYSNNVHVLSPRGAFEQVLVRAGDEAVGWPAFQDREGNRIVSVFGTFDEKVFFFGANGEEWRFAGPREPRSYRLRAIFDGQRHVIISANLFGQVELNGQMYGRKGEWTNFLFTLSYSGEVLSVQPVEVGGDIIDSAPGGYYLDYGTLLHRVNAEGKLLDSRALPAHASSLASRWYWAQDYNSGRVALAMYVDEQACPEPLNGFVVVEFDRFGAELLSRTFAPEDCSNGFDAAGVGFVDGYLFVGGSFRGTYDFGAGEVTSENVDGFILQLN